jgi:acyl-CoA synthetase (AMP-forming)/AMP-acid ligase II
MERHHMPHDENSSIVARLQQWGQSKPDDLALVFLTDGENETCRLTFGELNERAQKLSGRLIRAGLGGQPVLLLAQSDPEFILAMCGCLFAGAIAVPAPFPSRNRGQERIRAIVKDAGTVALIAGLAAKQTAEQIIPGIDSVSIGGPSVDAAAAVCCDPAMPALLQYTSGSIDEPKGVIVTHRNLVANIEMLSKAFGVHPDSRVLTWLPLFHDMGLIGNVLSALYCGVPCLVMPPLAFFQKPKRWLDAISRYRITISGGPNFAYELCVRRLEQQPLDKLDLSSWELAVCAAEPVRLSTMQRFARVFGPAGFAERALYPCYGLAEATVFVSGGNLGEGVRTAPADAPSAGVRVSCGRSPAGGTVTIVDPDRCEPMPDGAEGEIWVCGDHVAAGYWKNPAATMSTFGARLPNRQEAFLRTGDLGLKWWGEIYVTGRRKSLIIHRGVNLHPEDIEATIGSCHPGFGLMGAAFSIDKNDEEQVVVTYEVMNSSLGSRDSRQMIEKALSAVAEQHGVRLFDAVLVPPGALPRTTSGKIQRDSCRILYLSGELARRAYDSFHPSLGRYQAVVHSIGPDRQRLNTA